MPAHGKQRSASLSVASTAAQYLPAHLPCPATGKTRLTRQNSLVADLVQLPCNSTS